MRAGRSPGSKRVVEAETTLGLTKEVLDLLVESPTPAHLELVGAMGPGDVITDLVVVGLVVPRPTGDFEIRAALAAQVDVGDAGQVVRSSEEPGVAEVARPVVVGTIPEQLGRDKLAKPVAA